MSFAVMSFGHELLSKKMRRQVSSFNEAFAHFPFNLPVSLSAKCKLCEWLKKAV
jgi:hypothetical protein